MTKLYLIRHAEAEGNLYRIAQGQYNSILTDLGQQQVRALERRFADIHIDAVYASDLYRTCATAAAIYIPKKLPLHRCRDLREICVGVWEQKTWGEIARTDPEQMENFSHRLHLWHAEGAETPAQVRDRVLHAVEKIAAENDGRTVAVFSHGCAIRILLATVQGYSLEQLGQTPTGSNTAVSLLEWEGGKLHVVYRDDASHLEDPRFTGGAVLKKHPNALEPGLWFRPLALPEDEAFFTGCVQSVWQESGRQEPFDARRLLSGAAGHTTLVGCLPEGPVGVVQLDTARDAEAGIGYISLLCLPQAVRQRGFGVQLLGQAVAHYRPLGRQCLRTVLESSDETGRAFFIRYGFTSVGKTPEGREILEKNIGYRPEFLGNTEA